MDCLEYGAAFCFIRKILYSVRVQSPCSLTFCVVNLLPKVPKVPTERVHGTIAAFLHSVADGIGKSARGSAEVAKETKRNLRLPTALVLGFFVAGMGLILL